jgi:DNA-binding transcriptional MerR regulator
MFKIGEFSRLSRVSVRMLRYYDQLGLLKPSQTDSSTNYRYYSADQLPRLNRILALRDLGFSLEQIKEMLEEELSSEQLLGMLKLKRAEIEQQMQVQQGQMTRLEARIRQMNETTDSKSYEVILRDIGPQLVATYREIAADDDRIQSMFNEVETCVARFDQARADKPPFAIYYDAEYRERDIDAEVAIPLKFPIPGTDDIHVRELPGVSNVACVVHSGSYVTLYQAYNALLSWIEANHYRMAGPIREVYLRYGADGLGFDLPPTYLGQDSNQYVTELQLPVEKR